MKKTLSILILASVISSQGATVNWGAGTDNGFSVGNTDLASGNWARIGYFDVSDSVLSANAFDLSFLNSHFTEFAATQIGLDLGGPGPEHGHFSASSGGNPAITGGVTPSIVGLQVYYWVFSSTNRTSSALALSSATAHGVFYANKNTNSGWAFPSQNPVPGSTTTDITDLTDAGGEVLAPGAAVVIGSFGTDSSNLSGSKNFGLAPVPEPTSAFLVAIGAAGLMMRRRRQS